MIAPPNRGGRNRLLVALAVPPVAWATSQIGLAGALRLSCDAVGSGLGAGWSIAALMACAFSAALAWRGVLRQEKHGVALSRFGARVALLGSGVFALAIAFQALAILIVPSCAR